MGVVSHGSRVSCAPRDPTPPPCVFPVCFVFGVPSEAHHFDCPFSLCFFYSIWFPVFFLLHLGVPLPLGFLSSIRTHFFWSLKPFFIYPPIFYVCGVASRIIRTDNEGESHGAPAARAEAHSPPFEGEGVRRAERCAPPKPKTKTSSMLLLPPPL